MKPIIQSTLAAAVFSSFILLPSAFAEVPGIINYQGRVTVGGTNFNGTGQFKFALVNSGATATYWSNGVNTVALTVTKGLYSVLLGDTGIANMATNISASVFTNTDVRLRVWFNDGVSGLQQLSPDQRLASAGYALTVANVRAVGFNTLVGEGTGSPTSSGNFNTAIGNEALFSNSTGSHNTANGWRALYSNTSGYLNTACGEQDLWHNTTGYDNVAVGAETLFLNTIGYNNTAVGDGALYGSTNGSYNTASGYRALYSNKSGYRNTAVGNEALYSNTSGIWNTAMGDQAMHSMTTGSYNTAIGYYALYSSTTGSYNIAIGSNAGQGLFTGSYNIYIGNQGGAPINESRAIRLGTQGTQTNTYIAGIWGTLVSAAPVYVDSSGKLGYLPSSRRFKQAIEDMGDQSDVLLALRPVAFRYKPDYDPLGAAQFGLIAEEVERVAPALVLRDAEGKINSVRYEQVNAMLLNEFLKQHRQVQELKQELQELKAAIATMRGGRQ